MMISVDVQFELLAAERQLQEVRQKIQVLRAELLDLKQQEARIANYMQRLLTEASQPRLWSLQEEALP